jgi:hypothetical protein
MDRFGAAAALGVLHAAETPAAIAITAPAIACRHMPIPAPGLRLVAIIRARKCTPYWRMPRPLSRICRDQRSTVGFSGTLLDVQARSAEVRKRPLSCNYLETQQDPRPSLPTNDGGGPAFVRRIPHPCADGWLPGIRYSVRRAGGRALRARVFTSDTPSASPASLSVMRVPAFCRVKRPYRQAGSLPEQEFFGRLLSRRVTGVRLVGQVSRRAARRWPGRPPCACPPGCPAWP